MRAYSSSRRVFVSSLILGAGAPYGSYTRNAHLWDITS
jgi:hypothetical protein